MTEQEQQIALFDWWGTSNVNTDSLDVLHEMEMRLNVNQLSDYADILDKVCVPTHICPLTHWESVVCATAAQRREALLRTLGLWKET